MLAALGLALAGAAQAQDRHRSPGIGAGHGYSSGHGRGHVAPGLPNGAVRPGWHGTPHDYRHGVWLRPHGPRWRVVAPPIGIVVPFLSGGYASLWIGGAPHFYANDVYYAPAPGSGYTVVAPPDGAERSLAAPAAPSAPDPVIYPRNGQTAEQTETDRQQCNTWATTQPQAVADAAVFQRAVAACMDGRGYTVR